MNHKSITQFKLQLFLAFSFLLIKSISESCVIKNVISNLNYQGFNQGIKQANVDINNQIDFIMQAYNQGAFYDTDEMPTLYNALLNTALFCPFTLISLSHYEQEIMEIDNNETTRWLLLTKKMFNYPYLSAVSLVFSIIALITAAIVNLYYLSLESQQLSYGAAYDLTYLNHTCHNLVLNNTTIPIYPSYSAAPAVTLSVFNFAQITIALSLLGTVFAPLCLWLLKKCCKLEKNVSLGNTASLFSHQPDDSISARHSLNA